MHTSPPNLQAGRREGSGRKSPKEHRTTASWLGALRAAERSSINDNNKLGDLCYCFWAKSFSQQTWLGAEAAPQSPYPPALPCLGSPSFRTHRALSRKAWASVAALDVFAAFPAPVECLWQVASHHGQSLLAPPEGHLLLDFTIARAYGLRPPSRIW